MRVLTIILLIVFLALAGLTGYLYLNTNVMVTGIDCTAVDALDQPELFQRLKEQANSGKRRTISFLPIRCVCGTTASCARRWRRCRSRR